MNIEENCETYFRVYDWMTELFKPSKSSKQTDRLKRDLFALIYSYTVNGEQNGYYGGLQSLADRLGTKIPTVCDKLNELTDEGFIFKEEKNGSGFIHFCIYKANLEIHNAVQQQLTDDAVKEQLTVDSTSSATINCTVQEQLTDSSATINGTVQQQLTNNKYNNKDNNKENKKGKSDNFPVKDKSTKSTKECLKYIDNRYSNKAIVDSLNNWYNINLKGKCSIEQLEYKLNDLETFAPTDNLKLEAIKLATDKSWKAFFEKKETINKKAASDLVFSKNPRYEKEVLFSEDPADFF